MSGGDLRRCNTGRRGALVAGLLVAGAVLACASGRAEARSADGCRPLQATFYAAIGSVALAQGLAASPSPCAGYDISVPPLAADKTQMRSGSAPTIRALGPGFHALAEVNSTAWGNWVASTGSSWYQAGVEARRRMAGAGFDVAAGDTWAVNELSSAVRIGTGASRQNIRDLVHGLYDGDGGPPAKGVVFVTGISQPTTGLDTYKARLESWLQDAQFWGDMSAYVSGFLQEDYGDVRNYAVAGADVPTRLGFLNAYLQHVLALGAAAPPAAADAARASLDASYAPLANAAWAWTSAYGFTAVTADQMQDFVSAEVDAMRSYDAALGWSGDRIGFAWDPNNSLGLSGADFNAQTAAIVARLAAAIQASADPAAPGDGACRSPWCTAALDGAAFTPAWSTFSTWTPTGPAFGSLPETVAAGVATGPMSVEPQIGGIVVPLPVDTTAGLTSSSSGGSFSTSPTGPWTPTLDVTIPAGSTSATFYMLDSQGGTPTVTATIGDQSAAQPQVVTAPAAPLALTNGGNVTAFAAGGAPVAVDPALALSDAASPTVVSASVAIATGYTPGDVLTATTVGTSISAAYANGTLTLSGTDSLANYQAVLQSVAFSGTATTGGTRTVLWTVADGSTSASAVSTIAYTAAPSAPTGAAASAGDGEAVVSFAPPASDGGSPITSYTVTSSPGGITATGAGSPIALTGLANGTSYSFTVSATNAVGTGPTSAASNSVTPGAPVSAGAGGGGGGGGGGSGGTGPAVVPVTPATPIAPAPPLPAAGAPAAPAGVGKAKAAAVVLTVAALRPVILRGSRPAVSLVLRISKSTTLVVSLRDGRGRPLASWRRHLRAGVRHLSLVLPPKARHAGRDRLRLSWTGGRKARMLALTVRRPAP